MVRPLHTTIACLFFSLIFASQIALAATGEVITIPAKNVKRPGPIKLTYDFNWVDGNGYRPVRVTAATINGQPVIGEQKIQITMYPGASHPATELFGVTGEVTIPDGAKSAKAWLYIPQGKPWLYSVFVRANINGANSPSLTANLNMESDYAWSEVQPSFLFVDSAAPSPVRRESKVAVWKTGNRSDKETFELPNVSRLGDVFMRSSLPMASPTSKPDALTLAFLEDNDRVELRAPSDLPDEWIGYSCLSVIFISLDEAQKIAKTKQFNAIKEWTAAGGVLCIFGVGDEFENLAAAEKLLEMQPLKSGAVNKFRGWSPPAKPLSARIDAPLRNVYSERDFATDATTQATSPKPPPSKTPLDPSRVEFVSRRFQLGKVLAIGSQQPMNLTGPQLAGVMNEADYNYLMWRNRQGFSLNNENTEFWHFLLPGVGGAPVISFLILITIFVVVIGPVNYFVLRELKRLYLILITVPLGAAVVTLSLFFFALVTDGIQTRVRVRSFTDIDQQAQHAASVSRQTYYAGIAPGGLTFPRRATVFPVEYQPAGMGSDTKSRAMAFSENSQHLQVGFISSRNWSQFMVTQSQPSKRGIELLPDANGEPLLKNLLDANIKLLVLADENGDYWLARDVRNGDTAAMAAAKLPELQREFSGLLKDNHPAAPENFDPTQMSPMNGMRSWYPNQIDGDFDLPEMKTSILERGVSELKAIDSKSLQPRTYYAIVDHSPEVSLGVSWPSLEAGFEVIRGSW